MISAFIAPSGNASNRCNSACKFASAIIRELELKVDGDTINNLGCTGSRVAHPISEVGMPGGVDPPDEITPISNVGRQEAAGSTNEG